MLDLLMASFPPVVWPGVRVEKTGGITKLDFLYYNIMQIFSI